MCPMHRMLVAHKKCLHFLIFACHIYAYTYALWHQLVPSDDSCSPYDDVGVMTMMGDEDDDEEKDDDEDNDDDDDIRSLHPHLFGV